jgi:imidazolonepropionase
MPRLLIVNAGQLLTLAGPDSPRSGRASGELGVLARGALLIDGGLIAGVGPTAELSKLPEAKGAEVVDAAGRVVMPGFVDSHAHPVFAKPRLDDFSARLRGAGYAEIAKKGGGILSSVAHVRAATEDSLVEGLRRWARVFLEYGTTTLEAKSGYGLTLEAELKMLRAIRRVAQEGPLELVPTFMAAHAVPPEFERSSGYVEHIVNKMLPAVASERLAEYVDVFCEDGYFTPADAEAVLTAAESAGMKTKIHADQLGRTGGAEVAAKVRASTADHLDCVSPKEIERLKKAGTVAVLAPGSNFFLGKPYPPARALVSAGVPVALASDFNPGTCPGPSLQLTLSIACGQLGMTAEEAIVAGTINGAHAVGRSQRLGSLETGKQADVLLLDATDYRELPYYFGVNHCRMVIKKGEVVWGAA